MTYEIEMSCGLNGEPYRERGNTILALLSEARVVDFDADGGVLVVSERCDGYYKAKLTKEQAQQLIAELQSLVEKL